MIRHFFSPATGDYLYSSECADDTPFTTAQSLPDYIPPAQKIRYDGTEWLLAAMPEIELQTEPSLPVEDYLARRNLLELRQSIFSQHDAESQLGKTSNALSASLNLQLKIFSALCQAQTVDDVRNAALIAAPLMTRVQGMLQNNELLSVQAAQNISDEDAIVEALEAMTKVARVIEVANK